LYQQKDFAGAIVCYRRALKTLPDSPIFLNNLAFLLANCPETTLRNGPEAVQFAEKACQLMHYQEPASVVTLATAYAEAGRLDDALAAAEKACALAAVSGDQDILERSQELLALYRAQKQHHEAANPNQTKSSTPAPHP
jgi:tetratricopeptide (TPR) repeat protein